MITYLGQLSLGQLQVGISAALPALKLRLAAAKGASASITANIDKSFGIGVNLDALLAGFNVDAALKFNPPSIGKLSAQISADMDLLSAKIELITGQIAIVQGALNAGAAAWNYRGPTNSFGGQLGGAVAGSLGADTQINAQVLLATEPAFWAALSAVMFVGATPAPVQAAGGALNALGTIPGAVLLPGLALTLPGIQADLGALAQQLADKLKSLKLVIELSLQIPQSPITLSLGLTGSLPMLPSLTAMLPTASLGLQLDLGIQLGLAKATELALEPIVASFETALDSGGISAWSFSGKASAFGSELSAAIGPSTATANAFALVCSDPSAWLAFSKVLKVN